MILRLAMDRRWSGTLVASAEGAPSNGREVSDVRFQPRTATATKKPQHASTAVLEGDHEALCARLRPTHRGDTRAAPDNTSRSRLLAGPAHSDLRAPVCVAPMTAPQPLAPMWLPGTYAYAEKTVRA